MSMAPIIAHGQPIGMYPAPMMTPHCCPCVPPPVHVTTVVLDHQHESCRRGPRWINRSLRRKVLGLAGFNGACAVVGGVICMAFGLGFFPIWIGIAVLAVPVVAGLVEIEMSETQR